MKKIILASGSPRRKEILDGLGIPFEVRVSSIDESNYINDNPFKMVMDLSYEKAKSTILDYDEDLIIIGADTIVVYENQILGKPRDSKDAFDYLKLLSGTNHEVYTGISMINPKENKEYLDYCKTKVFMRDYSDKEINSYINTKEPFDKAGAYGIQGYGSTLISKIEGDYYNIVGLPISKLIKGFKFFNINYFDYLTFTGE